jgi:hypothetical protein
VLAEDRAFNAIDVAEALGCSAAEVDQKWDATKDNGRVKFGGGFYCALVDPEKKICACTMRLVAACHRVV